MLFFVSYILSCLKTVLLLRFIAKSLAEIFKFVALSILLQLFDHSLINQKTFLGVFSCSAIELLSLAQFATVFLYRFFGQ